MLDVVIVAKNEERHLGSVLSALKTQENFDKAIKVVVVDNGSTDNTREIARAHQVQVVESGGSLGKARNAGIACGESALVAFLDAHSIPCSNWAVAMTNSFHEKSNLGAAMGSIDNVCTRPGAQLFAKHSVFSTSDKLWRHTISGLDSPLPWIPTGNCVYSRAALTEVNNFNEAIFRCEDTDLSWRVVLKGYQLAYVPEARVTHIDQAGATSYLRKYYNYGAGAAELANLYGLQPQLPERHNLTGTKLILDWCYKVGFDRYTRRLDDVSEKAVAVVRFRNPFKFHDETSLALSRNAIYWLVDAHRCICVDLKRNARLVLEDTSAFIFMKIVAETKRNDLIESVCSEYAISRAEAAADIDSFVSQLIDEEILLVS